MPDLPAVRPREVVAALGRAGFFVHHQKGSHVGLRHRTDPARRVTVPMHNRDLKMGTLRGILRQAGVAPGEFIALLQKFRVTGGAAARGRRRVALGSPLRPVVRRAGSEAR